MPIIHYPGYITKEHAAKLQRVQVRTINRQIKDKVIPFVRIDGMTFVKDTRVNAEPPAGIDLSKLQWVYRFARKHKMMSDLVYEQIILGKITGVTVANRVFVISNEPHVVVFLADRIHVSKTMSFLRNKLL